ncbi:hypothetical protein C5S39_04655 [Candidatus Methanophagaceae archaeon]|nr:hypothetical protein C5S39_04655 [Methanophagales archaeon]
MMYNKLFGYYVGYTSTKTLRNTECFKENTKRTQKVENRFRYITGLKDRWKKMPMRRAVSKG